MTRSWALLLLSAVLQVGWVVSLRQTNGFTRLGPVVLFALFGFTSTVCLSKALEGIPMSTAYAVWTGVSVAGSVLLDVFLFRSLGLARLICILLILLGTTGLKLAGEEKRPGAGTPPEGEAAPTVVPHGVPTLS